ncbi:hypothetical protein HID58_043709 [Brassica napus]|uniref:Uncharacterized protein n=2 Tax=Brassica TaxID=3705 RepID=A0ABQ8BJ29_BRANA|nr:hypothetical protein HID58_043709 [Brassica napus]
MNLIRVRPKEILSGPIPKGHRSDESPPLQRRSFPFPLKQLLFLSLVLMVTPFLSRFRPPPDPPPPDLPPWSLCKSRPFTARFLIVPPEPPDAPLLLAPLLQTLESSINPVVFLPRCSSPVPVAAASPLRFQHSSSFQLEPYLRLLQAIVPQCGVGTRTFVLLALVSMVSGTDASKNEGLG